MAEVKVLDHGYVRLEDSMGNDASVVRSARVSYDRDELARAGVLREGDEKLIRYLLKNKHTSPFEAVTFTFEVKAPIFVLRQWHRHRTWSYNEVSARYTELPEEFYIPELSKITKQHPTDRQQRTDEQHPNALGLQGEMLYLNEVAFSCYRNLLSNDCPRELARTVLPVSVYSRMYASVDLHNLFHFLTLRSGSHAQYEIRVYAEALLELITPVVPACVAIFKELSA